MHGNGSADSTQKVVVPFKEYLQEQADQILSPENKWFAGELLGHEPSNNEAALHFVDCGAAKRFAETHIIKETLKENPGPT